VPSRLIDKLYYGFAEKHINHMVYIVGKKKSQYIQIWRAAMIPSYLHKINDNLWEISRDYKPGMTVPARVYGTEQLISEMEEGVYEQIINVSCLPGLIKYTLCMPDGHWGYGFPIGGACAMDTEQGVISPGGIGFDINCGMKLLRTDLTKEEVEPVLEELVDMLYAAVPTGTGKTGRFPLDEREFEYVVEHGLDWCFENGFADECDLARTEEQGRMEGADSSCVSQKAKERGFKQLGTLGSGNHYLEIQAASPEDVMDKETAEAFGITIPNQILVMIHCGSRGFGHQIATDYVRKFAKETGKKYGIEISDRNLACAPFTSEEGQDYFSAMKCAVNMAFVNRQMIVHRVREVFSEVFGKPYEGLGLETIYDVTHNTAKVEKHIVDGEEKELLIHRKGATRAFPPRMEGLPEEYRETGQPVILGGSMETGSYLLTGTEEGKDAFYTTAHGSGRVMGRWKAKKAFYGEDLKEQMRNRGIYIRSASNAALAEEAGGAYKNIDQVVDAVHLAGLSRKVVRLRPIGNIKG
jgi:tRNA-splicing ligase RtcB